MNTLGLPPIAILCGGLATRLRPTYENVPKALIPIEGRPFLQYQLRMLSEQGFRKVVLCTGHLSEQIEAYLNGADYELDVVVSPDGDIRRGTGGAIVKALPFLGDEFFIMYGDSYLPIDFKEVYRSFQSSAYPILMTVFRNSDQFDRSNVIFDGARVQLYDKKTSNPQMEFIDYGLSLFSASAFKPFMHRASFDLEELFQSASIQGRVWGFNVSQRFYEIGSFQGISDFKNFIQHAVRKELP